jgi:hypothetical protein
MPRKPSYGTADQVVVIDLASLASASATQSSVVTNTDFLDVSLIVKARTDAGSIGGQRAVYVYAWGTTGGTTYPDGVTGTAGSYTMTAPPNLVRIATIHMHGQNTTEIRYISSLAGALGNIPSKWGIVVENNCGITLDSQTASHAVLIQGQSVS